MILSVPQGAALLRGGGIVAYPTETFYALGALATRADALARLTVAKLRPPGKPLPLVAADVDQVAAVASLADPVARALAARFWPGPLTLVLPSAAALDGAVVAPDGTVAVRVPGAPVARELARQAGGPLVSTSANISGGSPPTSPAAFAAELVSRIDCIVDGGSTPGGLPSTIVSVAAGQVTLVRAGAVPWRDVLATSGGGGE